MLGTLHIFAQLTSMRTAPMCTAPLCRSTWRARTRRLWTPTAGRTPWTFTCSSTPRRRRCVVTTDGLGSFLRVLGLTCDDVGCSCVVTLVSSCSSPPRRRRFVGVGYGSGSWGSLATASTCLTSPSDSRRPALVNHPAAGWEVLAQALCAAEAVLQVGMGAGAGCEEKELSV